MPTERERKAKLGIEAIQKLKETNARGAEEVDPDSTEATYVFHNKSTVEAKVSISAGGKRFNLEMAPAEEMFLRGDLSDDEELGIMTLLHNSTVTLTVLRPGGKVRHFEPIAPTETVGGWDKRERRWRA